MRTLLRCTAAAIAVALLAACGPNGSGGSADPSPTTMSDAEVLTLGKEVAQCFRDNGIPDFPDPIVDNNGQLQLPNNMEAQLEDLYPQQVLEQAQQACQSLFDRLPESAIGGGGNEGGDRQEPVPGTSKRSVNGRSACGRTGSRIGRTRRRTGRSRSSERRSRPRASRHG